MARLPAAALAALLLPGCLSDLDVRLFNHDAVAHAGRLQAWFEGGGGNRTLLDARFEVGPGGAERWDQLWSALRPSEGAGRLTFLLRLDNGTVARDVQEGWRAGEGPNALFVGLDPGRVAFQRVFAD